MFPEIKTDIPALDAKHDNRHKLDDSENSRESLAFVFEIPEENVGGFFYTWVNGKGLAGSIACLFGEGIGDTPIFEHCDGIAVPDDMDFNDWRVKGLHLQLKESLKTVQAHYKSDTLEITYDFEALHPAYAYGSHLNGCPQWIADNRFEQQGLAKGMIKIGDRTIEINGASQRDHSWGTREWGVNQHWKWLHAQADSGCCVHFWDLYSLGKAHLCGYVSKDGHMAQIKEVTTDFTYDDNMQPVSLNATVVDELGRTTDVKSTVYGVYPFEVDPMITLFESSVRVTIDGHKGNGWLETQWPSELIEYMSNKNKNK